MKHGHGVLQDITAVSATTTQKPRSTEIAEPPRRVLGRQASNSSNTISPSAISSSAISPSAISSSAISSSTVSSSIILSTTFSYTSTTFTRSTTSTANSTITTPPTPTATSSEPCQAKTCGAYTKYPCSGPLGNCACGKDTNGKSFCFQNDDCVNETSCPEGTGCPSGFACLVGSCCGVNKCVRKASGSTCQNSSLARLMFRAVDVKGMSY
ncbi:hypothetical protein QBC39DRAFT_427824, partial [Podospora conica]